MGRNPAINNLAVKYLDEKALNFAGFAGRKKGRP
jgi:hypothetical protein